MVRATNTATPKLVARASRDQRSVVISLSGPPAVCEDHHFSVPTEVRELPHNQKRRFRHVCAGCAYDKGYADGFAAAEDALKSK